MHLKRQFETTLAHTFFLTIFKPPAPFKPWVEKTSSSCVAPDPHLGSLVQRATAAGAGGAAALLRDERHGRALGEKTQTTVRVRRRRGLSADAAVQHRAVEITHERPDVSRAVGLAALVRSAVWQSRLCRLFTPHDEVLTRLFHSSRPMNRVYFPRVSLELSEYAAGE